MRVSDRPAAPGGSAVAYGRVSQLLIFRNYLDDWPKSAIYRFRPVPVRGAFRDRHKRGMGCGGRGCAFDEWCGCVRWSRVVLTPRCWRQAGGSHSAGDGDNEPGPTGESTI